ncbi:hypothetical protein J2S11_003419 [Bacillus horti]|uniref:Uncharacterized protein n=1 Tax=Caldalkalibacillus horti TaxID=77523 RepID=A0ABT9W344_9BACI|nr:hypothetical protein [Bacillus horti]
MIDGVLPAGITTKEGEVHYGIYNIALQPCGTSIN